MKRMTFVKAVAKYHKRIVRALQTKAKDDTLAQESTQEAIMSLLKHKSYLTIEGDTIDEGMFRYLKDAARKTRANIQRKQEGERTFMSSDIATCGEESRHEDYLPDQQFYRTVERDPWECPFCHTPGSLNEHGACGLCHTILPRTDTPHEHECFSIEESELLTESDLEMKLDVQKALSTLSEHEQLVINAVVHNVGTLEELSIRHNLSLSRLWRMYIKAKAKLSIRLVEYAFER
jgi:DNA-directed RNA polymerase specialized sigma24 family protein